MNDKTMENCKNWYLINTKSNKEFFVKKALTKNLDNVEVYCPKYIKNQKPRAFFPNYLFSKFNPNKLFHTIKYTIGVRKIVRGENGPLVVPEKIIKTIKSNEKNGYIKLKRKNKNLKKGDKIRIEEGPLEGVEGIFQEALKDPDRVRILVSVILVQTKKEYINKI